MARLFCQTVVDSWRWRRKQRSLESRWWYRWWWKGFPSEKANAAAAAAAGRGRRRRSRARAQQEGPQWVEFDARSFQREALSKREATQCALPGEEMAELKEEDTAPPPPPSFASHHTMGYSELGPKSPGGGGGGSAGRSSFCSVPPNMVVYLIEAGWERCAPTLRCNPMLQLYALEAATPCTQAATPCAQAATPRAQV